MKATWYSVGPVPGATGAPFRSSTQMPVARARRMSAAQACEASVKHLRTGNGRQEIDLIVEADDRRVLAIEVKLAQTVTDHDVRHLHWLAEKIGDDLLDAVVVTTVPEAYRRRDGVAVVPAGLLGP